MKANYWHKGEAIDYNNTTGSKIAANSVVNLITRIGVAGTEIQPSQTGSIYVEGIFKMAKASSEAIAVGTNVYYDSSNDCITATAESNIPAGYAVQSTSASDDIVIVKLQG